MNKKSYVKEVVSSNTGNKYSVTLVREVIMPGGKPEIEYEIHKDSKMIRNGYLIFEEREDKYETTIQKAVDENGL